jgi:hypothetical protein
MEYLALRIACKPEAFATLRTDQRLWQVLALARLVNSLRFAHAALPASADDTPNAIRQRLSSFFLTASLLNEGIPLVQRLGKHFRHLKAYQERFQPILQDRDVEALLSGNLKPLRNEAVSHFLEGSLGPRLTDQDSHEAFVIGLGRSQGQTYYQLADLLALRAFTGPTGTSDEFQRVRDDLVQRTTNLAVHFLSASDRLIGEALLEMGWHMERHSNGEDEHGPPQEAA